MIKLKTKNKFEKFMVMGITCILALNLGIGVVEAASTSPLQDSQKMELVVKSEIYRSGTRSRGENVIKPIGIIGVRENQSTLDKYIFKFEQLNRTAKDIQYMTSLYTGLSSQNQSHSVENLNEEISISYKIDIKHQAVSTKLIQSLIQENSNPDTRNYSFLEDSNASGGYTVVIGNKIAYNSVNNTITEIANEVGLKYFSKNFDTYKARIVKESQAKINTFLGEQAVSINGMSISSQPTYKDINELTINTNAKSDSGDFRARAKYTVKYTINSNDSMPSNDVKTIKRNVAVFVNQKVDAALKSMAQKDTKETNERMNEKIIEAITGTFKVAQVNNKGQFAIKIDSVTVNKFEVDRSTDFAMKDSLVQIGEKVGYEANTKGVLNTISNMRIDQSLVKSSALKK